MSGTGDFDGPPLVAGSVFGVRSFRVDERGRLTGMTVHDVFRPGENTARCVKTRPDAKDGHVSGQAGCTCGYWAYYDGTNPYRNQGVTVTAVIEGYGRVTLGTRGFRAGKARLVALVAPADEYSDDGRFTRCLRLYSTADRPVPVYGSLWEALAAHPVGHPTHGQPRPETEDGFWDDAAIDESALVAVAPPLPWWATPSAPHGGWLVSPTTGRVIATSTSTTPARQCPGCALCT